MTRSRSALAGLVLVSLAVTGCSGRQRPATQSSVADDVEQRLIEDGYVAEPGGDPVEYVDVDPADADAIGNCVGRTMFEDSANWSKDERDAATQVLNADEPDPDLVAKLEDLVNSCYDDVVGGGGGADDEEQTSTGDDEDETTTTARSTSDEETTTTEG